MPVPCFDLKPNWLSVVAKSGEMHDKQLGYDTSSTSSCKGNRSVVPSITFMSLILFTYVPCDVNDACF